MLRVITLTEGTGTENDPYIIRTLEQLNEINVDLTLTDKFFKLGQNIDAADTENWDGGAGWSSINGFSGSFDGDGFAILNYVAGQNKTVIQIILSDFTPNKSYGVRIAGTGFDTLDAIYTDSNGHGNFHSTIPGNFSTSGIELYLDLNNDSNFQPGELRAVGHNPASQ